MRWKLILFASMFACSTGSTSPSGDAKAMDIGYVWIFLVNSTDTSYWRAIDTLRYQDGLFYRIANEKDTSIWSVGEEGILSLHILRYGDFVDTFVVRELVQNVSEGDSWSDTLVVKPDTIKLIYERFVRGISEVSVPYGNVLASSVERIERYVHVGITPDTGIITRRNTMFFNTDLFLVKIVEDTLSYELLNILR